jgi:hypothetical protein
MMVAIKLTSVYAETISMPNRISNFLSSFLGIALLYLWAYFGGHEANDQK